ncbi:MAG: DUF1800 domain-containing protein, partial [Ktedonobacterales bacterium]|nr:DUF1800 domain-containing protein [Ktedonobacterales bacterium]
PTRVSAYNAPPDVPPMPPRPPQPALSRRAVLIGAGAGALGLGAVGAGVGYMLTRRASVPNVFASDAEQINHLLRRAGFGPAPSDIGVYLDAGVQGAIDRLVNYASVTDDLDSRLSAIALDFNKPQDLIRWFLLRMIYSKRPLEEKMTLFWSGVLTSSFRKVGKRVNYLKQQNDLLRANAMGRFDDLIRAISTDPAMLWWLDGRVNTGEKPNENYSRELMELFTLGIVDAKGTPNYTQNDVHAGALALAGWTIVNGKGVLVPRRQYTGTVTYLGHSGKLGLDDVVKIVCAHPATARHIAWRMWNFFAYPTTLSDSVLQPMVDAYNSNDHSIRAMVRAMLTSSAFLGDKTYRARIKSPTEFIVGAVRGLGLELTADGIPQVMGPMGQIPFDPPDVAGWPGDQDSAGWLSTQAWMSRVNFTNLLVAAATGTPLSGTRRQGTPTVSGGNAVQQTIDARQIASVSDLLNYFVAALVDNQLADDRRAILRDTLTQAPTGGASLTLSGGAKISAAGVRQALYLLMSMPEYQMN